MSDKKETPEKDSKSDESKFNDSVFEKDEETPMGMRIKRPKSQDVVHKSTFLKDNSNFIAIAGSTGTGKSTALLTILPMFSNKTTHIVLASAKRSDPVHTGIEEYCADTSQHPLIEYHYVHESEETSNKIADILDQKKPDDHMIIIFDDYNINYRSAGADEYNTTIIKVFALLRSQNCSGIVITQSYSNLPTKCRENLTMRVVFSLGNVYSVRTLIQDVSGLFYNGGDDKQLRKDLTAMYNQVYLKSHDFLVVSAFPRPQIRHGWREIIYPPDQKGEVVGGETPKKRTTGKGIEVYRQKLAEAKSLGMPSYVQKHITMPQLNQFIAMKESKTANDDLVSEALEPDLSPDRLKRQLLYYIRSYKRTDNPDALRKVTEIANMLVIKGYMGEDQIRYLLKIHNLSDAIDNGDD